MHFLNIDSLAKEEVITLIKKAIDFKNGKTQKIKAKIANIFIEPSTRTQVSFQIAQDNLGMKRYDLNVPNSSFQKKEILEDTILTLQAMGIENFVIRHHQEEYWKKMNLKNNFKIINAGDGIKNHPSQALLDAMTIYEHFGRLSNLKIAIIGDLKFSRVFHSLKTLFNKFNSQVLAINYLDQKQKWDDFIYDIDVVIMLRFQTERHEIKKHKNYWQLNAKIMKMMSKNTIFMHPGPVNRDVEIASDILYDQQHCYILNQVENGVFMRMAILRWICKNI